MSFSPLFLMPRFELRPSFVAKAELRSMSYEIYVCQGKGERAARFGAIGVFLLIIGDKSAVMFIVNGGVRSEFHITLQRCDAFAVPRAFKCQTFGSSALQTR